MDPITVLVVDDDPGIVELVSEILEDGDCRVAGTTNPEQALDIVKTTPSLKLILTDIMMPGKTGPELIRQAFRLRPDMQLLFMTGGYCDVKIRKTDRVLTKPIDIQALKDAVGRALAGSEGPAKNGAWKGPERRRQHAASAAK